MALGIFTESSREQKAGMLKIAVDSRKNLFIQKLLEKGDSYGADGDAVDSTVFTSDEVFDVRNYYLYCHVA